MNVLSQLADQLLEQIHTTPELHQISTILESYAGNENFKSHARRLATDAFLPEDQKNSQLLELFNHGQAQVLVNFFKNLFERQEYWLFSSQQFDYFDQFVQAFQFEVEKVSVAYLVAAVEIHPEDIEKVARQLTQAVGHKIVISLKVKPTMVGGLQLRIENLVFDYSLKNKIRKFQRQWISSFSKTSQMVSVE